MLRLPLLLALATLVAAPSVAQRKPVSDTTLAMQAEQAFVRGMTRAYLGDYDAAIGQYERALQILPGQAAFLAALAEAHEAQGDVTTAMYFASRAVEAAPDEASTYRHLAGLQLVAGEYEAAIGTYEDLLAVAPYDLPALTALARIQQQGGRLDDALATYDRVLDQVGESGAVRTRMLAIYQRKGDTAGAIRMLEALVDLEPENRALRRELADLFAETGRTDAAVATLEALLAERPDDPDALVRLAALYRERGDDDRADALLGAFGEPGVVSEASLAQAAALYLRAGDDPAAAETARRLLEAADATDAADGSALLMLGDLRYRDEEWTAAADALGRALADDPRNPTAWAQLVAAHLRSGDTDAALDAAEEATLLFPGQYALVRIAAIAHSEAGEHRTALRLLDEALAILEDEMPDDDRERSDLLGDIGWAHFANGEFDTAVEWLTRAAETDEPTAMLLERLGDAEAARGRRDVARRHWQAALDLAPDRAGLRQKLDANTP